MREPVEDEFRTKCDYMIVFVLTVVVGQEDARSRKTSGASLGCPNNVEHVCAPTQGSHGSFKQKNELFRRPSIGTLDGGSLKGIDVCPFSSPNILDQPGHH